MPSTPLFAVLERPRAAPANPCLQLALALALAVAGSGCSGEPCSIRDNGDGTQTLACGGDEAILGSHCTAAEDADGTQTITCADGTQVTVENGVSCGLTNPGDGTVTFSCSDGTEWTFAPGCTNRLIELPTHSAVVADCPGGTSVPVSLHRNEPTRTHIVSGNDHTCGLRPDDTAHCWGQSSSGQIAEPQGEVFVALSAGLSHTCGLRANGSAHCWGASHRGQAEEPSGEVFAQLVSGSAHNCGLRIDGSAHCWGWNDQGQADVPAGERFVTLALGHQHSCGLRADGSPLCWGYDDYGQSAAPAGERFESLALGYNHGCGLRADGSARCWGANAFHQTEVPEGERFVQLAAGARYSCGLRPDGSVRCWGDTVALEAVPDGAPFVELASGTDHLCGVTASGLARCWGQNDAGQTKPSWHFTCRPAVTPPTQAPGLAYAQWAYAGSTFPNYASLGTPIAVGTSANTFWPYYGGSVAVRMAGYMFVPSDGFHTFGIKTLGTARLLIGDGVVVTDDEPSDTTHTYDVCLDAGWHPIAVEYVGSAGATLFSTRAAQGQPLASIPNEQLVH